MAKSASRRSRRSPSAPRGGRGGAAGGIRDWARELAAAETGAVVKPFGAQTPLALVYPSEYGVGMSSLGFLALAGRVNRRRDAACERAFAALRPGDRSAPRTMENGRLLREFPLIAFSVAFEMDYPRVVDVLLRSGIAPRWTERGPGEPLVIGGGKALTMNRLPMYDFFDVIVHGDGEEAMDWMLDAWEAAGRDRARALERMAALPGFEVPPLAPSPPPAPPAQLSLADRLAEFPCHSTILTPHTEFAMRGLIEISRGCPYKCEFCVMGYQPYRYRWRAAEEIEETARMFRAHTNRVGLVASAVGIHREIEDICERLDRLDLDVSFSSLRVEDVKPRMIETLLRSGQRILTIAPEAGAEALRRRLRKDLSDARIEDFVAQCFERGMIHLKLYYMIGLPGETEADVMAIARQTERLREIQLRACRPRGQIGRLNLNVGVFVPKPGTPLGEAEFCGAGEARRKLQALRRALGAIPNVSLHTESPREAETQAFLARAGREAADWIERAARREAAQGGS